MKTLGYWLGAFWTLVVMVEMWVLTHLWAALETWR